MKKVVNVSVGGRSFSLDEDAYARLLTYLITSKPVLTVTHSPRKRK